MARTEIMSVSQFMNKGKKVEEPKVLKIEDVFKKVNDPKAKRILATTT